MTRLERVKTLFRQSDEVCALEAFYRSGELHNGRNEIKPMRSEGWVIDREIVQHDEVVHAHYIVRFNPERQLIQARLSIT